MSWESRSSPGCERTPADFQHTKRRRFPNIPAPGITPCPVNGAEVFCTMPLPKILTFHLTNSKSTNSRFTRSCLFLRSSRARLFSIKMGFETVWFSRKGPKPSADGVKGKVISGKGTRECRYTLWRGKRTCNTQVRPCLASFLRGGTDFGTEGALR